MMEQTRTKNKRNTGALLCSAGSCLVTSCSCGQAKVAPCRPPHHYQGSTTGRLTHFATRPPKFLFSRSNQNQTTRWHAVPACFGARGRASCIQISHSELLITGVDHRKRRQQQPWAARLYAQTHVVWRESRLAIHPSVGSCIQSRCSTHLCVWRKWLATGGGCGSGLSCMWWRLLHPCLFVNTAGLLLCPFSAWTLIILSPWI